MLNGYFFPGKILGTECLAARKIAQSLRAHQVHVLEPSLYCLISFPAWSQSNSCLPLKLLQEEIGTWVLTKIALGFTSRLKCADSLKTWLMLMQQEAHGSKAALFLQTTSYPSTAPRPQGQHPYPLRLERSRYLDIWPNSRPCPVLVSTKRELGSHSYLWSLNVEGSLQPLSEGFAPVRTLCLSWYLRKLKFYHSNRGDISRLFKTHILYIWQ